MQMMWSVPQIQPLPWMEAILKLLHHQRPNPSMLATSHTLKSMDLVDLIATCQRHTRCSAAYCLRKKKGKQECRFGYPKPLQQVTTITTENGDPSLITARNDCLLNSYNPVQLSGWRENVDMQYVVSRRRVINYVVKYATKSEPHSKSLRTV